MKKRTPKKEKPGAGGSLVAKNVEAEDREGGEGNGLAFAGKGEERPKFFVVGVGASAGGLEAIGEFFEAMPTNSGMAFVVIQHLSPDYKSFMVELLSKRTCLPVQLATDGQKLLPDNIYLIPPKKNLKIFKNRLFLSDPILTRGLNLPIDIFFRSLAEDVGTGAIGVILSGTGSDGTLGIRAIKAAGGMVMVQSQESAQFDGMPRSAITTGLADFVLPPGQMAHQLAVFSQHPYVKSSGIIQRHQDATEVVMMRIFSIVSERCGTDFSEYKPSTIDRRIERRMSINQIHSLEEYARYLEESPREAQLLFNDLLISVTRFFRDSEAFKVLKRDIVPNLFSEKNADKQIRVWVPGCATGEEAYSIAILLLEEMERQNKFWPVKVFATDIARAALDVATQGIYGESSVAEMEPKILEKYFTSVSGSYRVTNDLRQKVVFARHDLMKDPPFTKLDLISCRNVLIYFQPVLQSKIFSLFQFSLKPGAFLFLGSSETLGDYSVNFKAISVTHKIFQMHEMLPKELGMFSVRPSRLPGGGLLDRSANKLGVVPPARLGFDGIFKEIISDCVDACIVLDENNEVLHLFGKAGEYLKHPEGNYTNNLLKLTAHNMSAAIATAIHRAGKDKEFTYENVHLSSDEGGGEGIVDLRVKELSLKSPTGRKIRLLYIKEKKQAATVTSEVYQVDKAAKHRIEELQQELSYSKESLQATIEELETTNEELQATNEELLASNEELQATNEELQSVNEELHTVNAENQSRIVELNDLNNDINNLLECANIGILLMDIDGRIRRISDAASKMTRLTQRDIGVPIEVVARNLGFQELSDNAMSVMLRGDVMQQELRHPGGKWFLLRMVPYTVPGEPNRGCIITLMDISKFKQTQSSLLRVENSLKQVMSDPRNSCLIITNAQDHVLTWSEAAQAMFGMTVDEIVGKPFYSLRATGEDKVVLQANLNRVLKDGELETEDVFLHKDGTDFFASLVVTALRDSGDNITGFSKLITHKREPVLEGA